MMPGENCVTDGISGLTRKVLSPRNCASRFMMAMTYILPATAASDKPGHIARLAMLSKLLADDGTVEVSG